MDERPQNLTKNELFNFLVEQRMHQHGLKKESFAINFINHFDKEETSQIEIEYDYGIFNVFFQIKDQHPSTIITDFKTIEKEWDRYITLSEVKGYFVDWLDMKVEEKIKYNQHLSELRERDKKYRENYLKREKIKSTVDSMF